VSINAPSFREAGIQAREGSVQPTLTPAVSFIGVGHDATRVLKISARDHLYSPNLVARLNLPNMAYAPEDKRLVYAQAVRGLIELAPSTEKRLKYLDFVDIYADLDDHERQLVGRVSAA
jgi:hypothetical protein